MAFAINLRSDDASAARLRALWKEAARFEDKPSMESLNYQPHITFAIYEEIELEQLRNVARLAFEKQSRITLSFARIRYFDGSPLILWAEPSPTPEIKRLHEMIHRNISPSLCHVHYRPTCWTPHVSLAVRIREERRREALTFCERPMQAIEVRFDVGDIVSFHPVRVIDQWPLA
jgi:2'-5' RNA ligase